jgi:hypothetical protein
MMLQDTRVSGFEAWSIYMAIKLHFSEGNYDAFKFNFKGPRLKESTFQARRDRYFFEKLARRYVKKKTVIEFFLANILIGQDWVGNMSDEAYVVWTAKMQRLQYAFKEEMSTCARCVENFDELFKPRGGQVPLYALHMSGQVSLETLCIVDILCNYSSRVNKTMSDPLGLIASLTHKINSYKPFMRNLPLQQKAFQEIVINTFTKS